MPIEIRELVIKAEIDSGNRQASSQERRSNGLSEDEIQQVVDMVVKIMKNKNER